MDLELCRRVRARFESIYGQRADAWSRVRLYPETVAALDEALALEPDLPTGAVLDLGCGRGRMLRELERRGFTHVAAADLSAHALRDARRHAGLAALADAAHLPFRDGAFVLATELTLLSSIEPVAWASLAREVGRVVAPSGFYLTEQVQRQPGHPLREPVETACKLPRTLDPVWGFRADDFDRLMAPGFERVLLAEVPVRDATTDTPSWVGLYRKM